MNETMPIIGLGLTDARTIGQQMQTGLTPFLNQMNDILRRRGSCADLDFRELMAAGSFAFLVLIFLKLFDLDRRIQNTNVKLDQIKDALGVIQAQLNTALQVMNDLRSLMQTAVNLLTQILAQLKAGLHFTGTMAFSGPSASSSRSPAVAEAEARSTRPMPATV